MCTQWRTLNHIPWADRDINIFELTDIDHCERCVKIGTMIKHTYTSPHTYTQTHTHTHIYIYIYRERERER